MLRSNIILSSSKAILVFILCGLCGCAGVGFGSGSGPSQAVIAFGVQPANIVQGQAATLSWQVTNAATFSISPAVGPSPLPMTGSVSVSPSDRYEITVRLFDANQMVAEQSARVP